MYVSYPFKNPGREKYLNSACVRRQRWPRWCVYFHSLRLCFKLKLRELRNRKKPLLGSIKEKEWPLLAKWGFPPLWSFSQLCKEVKGVQNATMPSMKYKSAGFFLHCDIYNLISQRPLFTWLKNSLMMCRNEIQLGLYVLNNYPLEK